MHFFANFGHKWKSSLLWRIYHFSTLYAMCCDSAALSEMRFWFEGFSLLAQYSCSPTTIGLKQFWSLISNHWFAWRAYCKTCVCVCENDVVHKIEGPQPPLAQPFTPDMKYNDKICSLFFSGPTLVELMLARLSRGVPSRSTGYLRDPTGRWWQGQRTTQSLSKTLLHFHTSDQVHQCLVDMSYVTMSYGSRVPS